MGMVCTAHGSLGGTPDPCLPAGGSGQEQLYFFGKQLGPRSAKAALVILFITGFLLLMATVGLSLRLRWARQRGPYQQVQTCALPTEAL